MSSSVTSSEARTLLPQLFDRVLAGEEVTITRHGRAAAVMVRPDALRARRAGGAMASAEAVREVLEAGRSAPLPAQGAMAPGRAEELVSEVRAGRSGR